MVVWIIPAKMDSVLTLRMIIDVSVNLAMVEKIAILAKSMIKLYLDEKVNKAPRLTFAGVEKRSRQILSKGRSLCFNLVHLKKELNYRCHPKVLTRILISRNATFY